MTKICIRNKNFVLIYVSLGKFSWHNKDVLRHRVQYLNDYILTICSSLNPVAMAISLTGFCLGVVVLNQMFFERKNCDLYRKYIGISVGYTTPTISLHFTE